MNQQINELSSKNEELEKQLSSTIEEKSSLNDKINSLETEKTDLENKVKELSTDETNPRIVQLLDENAKLKEKLSNLKQSVIQIKERLDNDIYNKLELKTKLLKETLQINEQLQKKIEALQAENEKSKATEDQLKIYRDKYNSLVKDKVEMENFSAHQEQTIKNLESEISTLNEDNQDKDLKYKQLDKTYLSIIRVIEEHKKTIKLLQDKLNKKLNDEKAQKLVVYEKEQEIALLRNFITSLKNENSIRNSQNESNIRYQIKKTKENYGINSNNNRSTLNTNNNQVLPAINSNSNLLKKEESFRIENSNSNKNFITVNDPEEENLKEITNLMKKIFTIATAAVLCAASVFAGDAASFVDSTLKVFSAVPSDKATSSILAKCPYSPEVLSTLNSPVIPWEPRTMPTTNRSVIAFDAISPEFPGCNAFRLYLTLRLKQYAELLQYDRICQ